MFQRIVLVEDDPSHAIIIKRGLKQYCETLEHYMTAREGIAAVEAQVPDLIITDLNLPDMSELEAVSGLVKVAGSVPVLVLTSSTSLASAVEAMKLGAGDYIVKNFDGDFSEVVGLALSRAYAAELLKAEQRRLEREMKTLRVAIEDSDDALALVDREGEIHYANASFWALFEECYGARSAQLCDMFSDRVKDGNSIGARAKKALSELTDGGSWSKEIEIPGESSLFFDVALSGMSVEGAEVQDYSRIVVWARDITGQKRRERFQREILSTTTHDLKGPLGAISLSSNLLQQITAEGEKVYDISLRIGSAARGAIDLIDEFLSARRIQEGSFILRPVASSLTRLTEEGVDEYQSVAAAKGVALTFQSEGYGDLQIDQLGYKRVLSNLLSNAIKFTASEGAVKVSVQTLDESVVLRVADEGTGMDPSSVKSIFERFSRLSQHDAVTGTGLGLFVVKSVVEAHGGSIEVESQPGVGTTFEVVFPKEPPVDERGQLISLAFA